MKKIPIKKEHDLIVRREIDILTKISNENCIKMVTSFKGFLFY